MDITNRDDVRTMVKSALAELNDGNVVMDSNNAVELLMGTWAVESNGGHFLKQEDRGPARSAWQIEHPTFNDIINRVHKHFKDVLSNTIDKEINESDFPKIELNHKLAAQICRLKYELCPGEIPDNTIGRANYWKKYYNTPLGAGTVDKYIAKYNTYAL